MHGRSQRSDRVAVILFACLEHLGFDLSEDAVAHSLAVGGDGGKQSGGNCLLDG